MKNYDDSVRLRDGELLARTIPTGERTFDAWNALAVFVCDEQLRPVIEAIDPEAMAQARSVFGLPEKYDEDALDGIRPETRESPEERESLEEAVAYARTLPKDEAYTYLRTKAMYLDPGDPLTHWLMQQMREMFGLPTATNPDDKEEE